MVWCLRRNKQQIPIILLMSLATLYIAPNLYPAYFYIRYSYARRLLSSHTCVIPILEGNNSSLFLRYYIKENNRKCNLREEAHNVAKWKRGFVAFDQKASAVHRARNAKKLNQWSKLNVYILSVDELSRSTVRYNLPKFHDYINNDLKVVVLEGYNVIDDGMRSALLPLLTGKLANSNSNWKAYAFDRFADRHGRHGQTIFDEFSNHGYVTMFADYGKRTLMPECDDMDRQPIDHLLHTTNQNAHWGHRKRCGNRYDGHVATLQALLEYGEEFYDKYPSDIGKLAIIHIGKLLTEDAEMADIELIAHLERMKVKGHLNNSLFIIAATRGAHFAQLRQTLQGKLEQRMPFLAIALPHEFRQTLGRQAWVNLEANRRLLTTVLDVHSTLLDILSWPTEEQISGPFGHKSQSISLWRPMPSRTCHDVGINSEDCVCFSWKTSPIFSHKNTIHDNDKDGTFQKSSEIVVEISTDRNISRPQCRTLLDLTEMMQTRINALQNPADCTTAKKLICNMTAACGFGCLVHLAARCFVIAYGLGRTMLLKMNKEIVSQKWLTSEEGWSSTFKPISVSCFEYGKSIQSNAGDLLLTEASVLSTSVEGDNTELVKNSDFEDVFTHKSEFWPPSFPKEFADELIALHGNPPAWFLGQFAYYLMRSSKSFEKRLLAEEIKIPFSKGPIVCLHIRRTDKVVAEESTFHGVSEYMVWVEEWFSSQSLIQGKHLKRRIFVSTDDPNAIIEIKELCKDYSVFSNINIASYARPNKRSTQESFYGFLTDVHILSRCDYVVGTFSSNVGRLVYELMQVLRGNSDASSRFHSIDDMYYHYYHQVHEQEAIMPHIPVNDAEIELRIGDIIYINETNWDGFSRGINQRTGQTGLYPSHKVKEKWKIVDFYNYTSNN